MLKLLLIRKCFVLSTLFFISCMMKKEQADLIVFNATVYICDENFSVAESFAVKDGKILSVGRKNDILSKYYSSNLIDAEGYFIYPGFNDSHCHFLQYGINKVLYADLTGTASVEEIINKLKIFQEENNNYWILGRGWDQNQWAENEFPDKEVLDRYFTNNPVYLVRVDGHAAWVNSKALEIAEINRNTHIEGGIIHLDKGKPSGILIDKAMSLVYAHIPEPDKNTKINALLIAQQDCFRYGLTSVSDAGLFAEDVRIIDSLHRKSELKIRIYAMLKPDCRDFETYVKNGIYRTDRLTVRSIKLFADGALGSRGACLIDPYADDPDTYGVMVNSYEYLLKHSKLAKANGWQVCIHAIGDSANRQVLKLFAELLLRPNDLRWRIEHAQVVHPDDFEMFKRFSIIPSVQTVHATSDMYWAEKRLGKERLRYAYAYKKLLEQNGWFCNGTDFPVEHINPVFNFYSAVARKDLNGFPKDGFQIENAISRKEALLSMTLWSAKASFEENYKGSLEPGKYADFIILDKDIMKINISEIPFVKVLKTYISGEKMYEISSIE